ncbi:MAG: hypothetical protein M3N32_01845 [Actinomycetota bacterium]|nr:hypothetical protein [Actinomycetota bacterium]
MMLLRAGSDSLALAVELFNRPVEVARAHAVLLLLGHSFEMLLKAVIYQRRGRIRDRGEPYTYEFKTVINVCRSDLSVIDEDDVAILRAIQQDRNAAAHETVAMSEDMLWLHVRSAVTIYKRILHEQFEQDLAEAIPARAVPFRPCRRPTHWRSSLRWKSFGDCSFLALVEETRRVPASARCSHSMEV